MKSIPHLIDLPEPSLVHFVLEKLERTYDAFGFLFDDVFRYDRKGWQYLFLAGVPRSMLGLDPRLQPGDIDVLIVPSRDGVIATEFIAGVEVKRLPLRNGVLGKNVDRYGVTQAKGLMRDGFPLVGILHIVVNEAGPPEHIREVEMWKVVNSESQEIEFSHKQLVDMTGSMAADLQIDRLTSRDIGEYMGFNAIALQRLSHTKLGFQPFPSYGRMARLNPNPSLKLLSAIRALADRVGPSAPTRN